MARPFLLGALGAGLPGFIGTGFDDAVLVKDDGGVFGVGGFGAGQDPDQNHQKDA